MTKRTERNIHQAGISIRDKRQNKYSVFREINMILALDQLLVAELPPVDVIPEEISRRAAESAVRTLYRCRRVAREIHTSLPKGN